VLPLLAHILQRARDEFVHEIYIVEFDEAIEERVSMPRTSRWIMRKVGDIGGHHPFTNDTARVLGACAPRLLDSDNFAARRFQTTLN
jgi:hypothetical protein